MAPESGRWTREYSDGSSAEFSVTFDAKASDISGSQGEITLHRIDSISIPVDMVDWFVERMVAAKVAILENKRP